MPAPWQPQHTPPNSSNRVPAAILAIQRLAGDAVAQARRETSPPTAATSPGVQNAPFSLGHCTGSLNPSACKMHLSNRGDAFADRNRHWNPSVCNTTAEMGDCPPFQLRIPFRSPMRSKSQFLYTSPASHGTRKIPCLERGGVQDPLRRPTDRGICRFPAARALILRWPCPNPPPDTGGVLHSGTGASRPGEQARAHVIHGPNHQNCNTIRAINPTRSREKLSHRTPLPKHRKPSDSTLEMASIALCNAFHFSLQPSHCENRLGAIALYRFPL